MQSELSFVDLDKEIGVRITRFPDGQQTLQLNPDIQGDVAVKCSINAFNRLELLACLSRAIAPNRIAKLFIPYMFGARSDRRFTEDGINYFSDVFLPLLAGVTSEMNLASPAEITTMDLHNPVPFFGYWGRQFWKEDVGLQYVQKAIDMVNPDSILFPDLGAKKRYLEVSHPPFSEVNYAEKTRDVATGAITGMKLVTDRPFGKKVLVIDDICDGGATFINLLPLIPEDCEATLYVTHGIFSKGLAPLMGQERSYSRIITTDSFRTQAAYQLMRQYRTNSEAFTYLGLYNLDVLEVEVPPNFVIL